MFSPKQSEVLSRLIGGSDKRDEQLRPLIEQALGMQ
jgi:hypothetical protein